MGSAEGWYAFSSAKITSYTVSPRLDRPAAGCTVHTVESGFEAHPGS